jgi:hypothetical protein
MQTYGKVRIPCKIFRLSPHGIHGTTWQWRRSLLWAQFSGWVPTGFTEQLDNGGDHYFEHSFPAESPRDSRNNLTIAEIITLSTVFRLSPHGIHGTTWQGRRSLLWAQFSGWVPTGFTEQLDNGGDHYFICDKIMISRRACPRRA